MQQADVVKKLIATKTTETVYFEIRSNNIILKRTEADIFFLVLNQIQILYLFQMSVFDTQLFRIIYFC